MTLKFYIGRALLVFGGSSLLLVFLVWALNGGQLSVQDTDSLRFGFAGTLFAGALLSLNQYFNDRIDKKLSGN